ncbi:MAG: sulfide-dependent adenosine diphosphate thiazole synthase [Candidatus Bathyarchaeota archaeon]|nr:sulfide-dependent adenosine diphosphate thiazole synthase [Candidatus Bathyarchaeota archaeon]MDH5662921.1 sulfide-dependent adenosine diphosphate thiazole synthase [Candidatus Bathyarchaeota archaeon]
MNVATPKLKEVDESAISRAIIQKAAEDWISLTETDVIVAGAGPSGLTAARYLAKAGLKTVVFERKLSFGGGIGGGGMQFHKVVVQSPADKILRDIGCSLETLEDGVYVVDTAAMIAKLAAGAIDAGAKVIFGVFVNDLIYRDSPLQINGAVVQWTSVKMSGLHVDPLAVKAKAVVDCTGHDAEVLVVASRKIPGLHITVRGEGSMWASRAEQLTVENTKEVSPGLFAAGMAVAALHQTPRMGPIFGGMLLSGAKVAKLVARKVLGENGSKVIPWPL